MTPIYVVPSYRRPVTLCAKTLHTLITAGVPPTQIHVWLADTDELADYRKVVPPGIRLDVSAPTLRASRNHIVRAYPTGTPLVFCDDDLDALITRKDDKTGLRVTDIPALVAEGFSAAAAAGGRLWGVYPTDNPMFMSDKVRTGLVFCIGVFYGHTIGGDTADLVDLHDKDDYERTIKCYLSDGATVRLEYAGVRTKYYTLPGGMQETRTDRSADRSAIIISRRYPALATMYRNKKGRAELRLKDTRGKP